jgi:hypothetical protein
MKFTMLYLIIYKYSFHIKNFVLVICTKVDGLTQSERCFTPEELERKIKSKWKDVVELAKNDEVNKLKSEEDIMKFFKLMKHSEYNIIDQLKRIPT